jgi:hypothetical protein
MERVGGDEVVIGFESVEFEAIAGFSTLARTSRRNFEIFAWQNGILHTAPCRKLWKVAPSCDLERDQKEIGSGGAERSGVGYKYGGRSSRVVFRVVGRGP